jgi:ABC-2 type transport system ATP-binding protein
VPAPTIAVRGGVVRFGSLVVLDDVDLAIQAGEIVGIVGANGSGKSTLLRVMANVLRLRSGSRVGPRSVAYLPADVEPAPFSSHEWLTGIARIGSFSISEAVATLERYAFEGTLDSPMRDLSSGNQRKVLLAATLCGSPTAVILDEPCATLDAAGQDALRVDVHRLARNGAAIVIAEHDAVWVDAVADRTNAIQHGKLLDLRSGGRSQIETEVTFRGPEALRALLLDRGALLGFREVTDAIADQVSATEQIDRGSK